MNPNPQPHLSRQQQPKSSFPYIKWLLPIILIFFVFGSCALCGIVSIIGNLLKPHKPTPAATTPTRSADSEASTASTPTSIGSNQERLAVAAEIRHYLRDQNIPTYVVASGTKLTVSYQVAQIEYAPDTFFQQQGKAGMERIANAGFETLVIEANDSSGQTQRKEFSVIKYRTK